MTKREIGIGLQILDHYSNNKISYPELVNQLCAIRLHLIGIPNEKLDMYKKIWEYLEELNAIVLDESSNQSINDFENEISKLLQDLKELLESLKKAGY